MNRISKGVCHACNNHGCIGLATVEDAAGSGGVLYHKNSSWRKNGGIFFLASFWYRGIVAASRTVAIPPYRE